MKRKICVITGSRADYGLLYWLLKEIQGDPGLRLQLVVTGTHLSPRFGRTDRLIKRDGFSINAEVNILSGDNTPAGVTRSLGRAIQGFAGSFRRLKPDVIVVLGDRYEIFAAAQAAMIARIPIAHIHGGEATEGLIDEAIRHSITKMAHLHFVSAEAYRQRVIQLGEQPRTVFNFGAPGLDHLARTKLPAQADLKKVFGLRFKRPVLLVTYHPVTLDKSGPQKALDALLGALGEFKNGTIVITGSNADPEGMAVNRRMEAFARKNSKNVHFVMSAGQKNYLGLLKHADVVIGNSSSGIIEAPSFKVPTVNIGKRQLRRLNDPSIINCAETHPAILSALQKALSGDFRRQLTRMRSVYGEGGRISFRIKEKLKYFPLKDILMKHFCDVKRIQ